MIVPDWVQEGDREKNIKEAIIVIMKEFGYDIDTMRRMPIPTFIELVNKLAKDYEEQEREMRRLKR